MPYSRRLNSVICISGPLLLSGFQSVRGQKLGPAQEFLRLVQIELAQIFPGPAMSEEIKEDLLLQKFQLILPAFDLLGPGQDLAQKIMSVPSGLQIDFRGGVRD